jgi:hypothetical protein
MKKSRKRKKIKDNRMLMNRKKNRLYLVHKETQNDKEMKVMIKKVIEKGKERLVIKFLDQNLIQIETIDQVVHPNQTNQKWIKE